MAQRHFSCVLSRTDNLSSLTKHLMRGFTPEILLKTRILAKVEASNHTVNPDWNFGKMQFFAKSAMSLFLLLMFVPTDISVSYKDMFRVSRFKFVDPNERLGSLNLLLNFVKMAFSTILRPKWPKMTFSKNSVVD